MYLIDSWFLRFFRIFSAHRVTRYLFPQHSQVLRCRQGGTLIQVLVTRSKTAHRRNKFRAYPAVKFAEIYVAKTFSIIQTPDRGAFCENDLVGEKIWLKHSESVKMTWGFHWFKTISASTPPERNIQISVEWIIVWIARIQWFRVLS